MKGERLQLFIASVFSSIGWTISRIAAHNEREERCRRKALLRLYIFVAAHFFFCVFRALRLILFKQNSEIHLQLSSVRNAIFDVPARKKILCSADADVFDLFPHGRTLLVNASNATKSEIRSNHFTKSQFDRVLTSIRPRRPNSPSNE